MIISAFDRIKKTIKLYLSYPGFREVFQKLAAPSNNRAILVGSPIHSNLGDHLIASECLRFVESLGFDTVIEIPEFVYELYSSKIHFLPTDTVFILGGGWMGNIYEDELVVEDILSQWSENRIIILPQTIYFSDTGKYSSVEQLKGLFQCVEKLYVCTRDRKSYELCLKSLGLTKNNCFLLPDMALLRLDRVQEKRSLIGKTIIYSLRNDIEKTQDTELLNTYRSKLAEKGYSVVDSSTALSQKTVRFRDREKYINHIINQYSEADLVITDRLHSMVFSMIAGTKCIAVDNFTHKVMGVKQEWLDCYPGIRVFSSADEVQIKEIEEILHSSEYPVKVDFSNKFVQLIEQITGK